MFGNEELYVGKEFESSQQFLEVWPYLFREFAKDAYEFSAFFGFEFSNSVVGFYNFCWFDEDGFACCAFVVDNAFDASLHGWDDGDDESAVAHGWCYVFFYQAFCLCRFEDVCKCSADTSFGALQLVADVQEFSACFVFDASVLVEYLFELADNGQEGEDAFGKFFEGRV